MKSEEDIISIDEVIKSLRNIPNVAVSIMIETGVIAMSNVYIITNMEGRNMVDLSSFNNSMSKNLNNVASV